MRGPKEQERAWEGLEERRGEALNSKDVERGGSPKY